MSRGSPAAASRSPSRTPVHVAFALQPSTQAIGSRSVRWGKAARSASVSSSRSGPSTTSRYPGPTSVTPAARAVCRTGSPCGPTPGCRGASSETAPSGENVWPAVVSVTAPTPRPAASTNARRGTGPDSSARTSAASATGLLRRASPRRISGALAPTCTATAPIAIHAVQ
nr:hypothetical protein [Blastococcus sp. TML/C7B]